MSGTDIDWSQELPNFREKTAQFYTGEMTKAAYKGFSGYYGSYAQRDGQSSMLRLRLSAGRATKDQLLFIADTIRKYQVERMHFTTCETLQLHDLDGETVGKIMEEALEVGIVTIGGGGDFPRNVMCSPLSGVDPEEHFDCQPYALAAAQYLMGFMHAEKLPRKLKVCFSASEANLTHATFRDLGFVARADGRFDVYSAGGLGNNPRLGVKVAEKEEPENVLYYILAMWNLFHTHGNYENRGRARTRYMQEALGGADTYRDAYQHFLKEAFATGGDLKISVQPVFSTKKPDGAAPASWRVLPQKQEGLYALQWHPIGGMPDVETFTKLADAIKDMEDVELRLAPDETGYFINLTGREAEKLLALTDDAARSIFECSVACIGSATCQVGLRDSQSLLEACVKAAREAELAWDALPQIHISGCPSSCGTHQTGSIGFRGAQKMINKVPVSTFLLYVDGCDRQGNETMGQELGQIAQERIPEFLVLLGQTVMESGMDYAAWRRENAGKLEELAAGFILE